MLRPLPQRSHLKYVKRPSTTELLSQEERDFSGTRAVTVYVMLPPGIINMECEVVVNPDDLMSQLRTLKSVKVDGVAVNTWWGIVEANKPQQYNWEGYKQLFRIVRHCGFKMQVIMSFHECGSDEVHIPLPKWIKEIGEENPDIYFTNREGTRNRETLTWGIDEEPVLGGRTAVGVYSDYMRSFRAAFDEFFQDGSIVEVELGLGPCGELRYPSCPSKHAIGDFQCYDKYMIKSLEKAAEASGHDSSWGTPPDDNANFFCEGGDYNRPRGFFFLKWYSKYLIDHGDKVLAMAKSALEGAKTSVKLSGLHWWHETASRAVEGTSGFCDGYGPIASMLRKRKAGFNFTCVNPEGFVWQVLNAAWDACALVSSENVFPCYDRQAYRKILEVAKPKDEAYGRCISAFTYRGLDQTLFEECNLREFQLFVKKMHGTRNKTEDVNVDDDMKEADKGDTVALDQNQCDSSRAVGSKKRKSSMS